MPGSVGPRETPSSDPFRRLRRRRRRPRGPPPRAGATPRAASVRRARPPVGAPRAGRGQGGTARRGVGRSVRLGVRADHPDQGDPAGDRRRRHAAAPRPQRPRPRLPVHRRARCRRGAATSTDHRTLDRRDGSGRAARLVAAGDVGRPGRRRQDAARCRGGVEARRPRRRRLGVRRSRRDRRPRRDRAGVAPRRRHPIRRRRPGGGPPDRR